MQQRGHVVGPGVVHATGTGDASYGNHVTVDHGSGVFTFYAHMRDAAAVSPGQQVTTSTVLGPLGQTGNATGPHLMGEAFGPLLLKSPLPARIVNVSSGAGSIASRFKKELGSYKMSAIHYRASKAALNMVTANQAAVFGEQGVKVFAYCPGFTVSNLSGMNTAESGAKPTSEAAAPIVEILKGARDGEHGKFLKVDGQYEW